MANKEVFIGQSGSALYDDEEVGLYPSDPLLPTRGVYCEQIYVTTPPIHALEAANKEYVDLLALFELNTDGDIQPIAKIGGGYCNIVPRVTGNGNLGTAALSWAGIFINAFKMPTGAGASKVLTSDADGNGSWSMSSVHDAVTLASSADTLLGLSGQELSLDTQTANYGFFGPISGVAAVPTFRAMVAADLGTALTPTFAGIVIADAGTIGLGSGKGLIQFDDETTDIITFMNCNVGIGHATPTYAKLVINGNLSFNPVAGEAGISKAGTADPYGPLIISFINAAGVNADGIVLRTANLAGTLKDRLTIKSDSDTPYLLLNPNGGNVGVNDSAPGEILDVNGNINATGVLKIDDVQVVSNRVVDAKADDTINTVVWDAATAGVLTALRDAMITHGLIAAA